MNRFSKLLALATLTFAISPLKAGAQNINTFILQSPSLAQAQAVCQKYGLTMVSTLHSPDTYLVQVSASVDPKRLADWMDDDDNVKSIELNKHLKQSSQKGLAPAVTSTSPTATYLDG